MKLTKIFIPLAVAMTVVPVFSSCSDDDEYYTAGSTSGNEPTVEDFNLTKTFNWTAKDKDDPNSEYEFVPAITDPTFTPKLSRAEAASAVTVKLGGYVIEGKDTIPYNPTSGIWSYPSEITLGQGQTSVDIPVTLLTRDLGSYKLILRVENPSVLTMPASAVKEWVMTANLQSGINWVLLDKGTYKDLFFYDGGQYPFPTCEIYYDASSEYGKDKPGHYGHYLIHHPYDDGINNTAGLNVDDPTTYIEFYVMGPDEAMYRNEDVIVPAGKYYLSIIAHSTGVEATYYGEDIWAMYPYNFSGMNNLSDYEGQQVLVWKDGVTPDEEMMAAGGVYDPFSEENINEGKYPVGKPGAFALGTIYYLRNAGDYYENYLKNKKAVQFIFPGVTVGDYGFNVSYNGHVIGADKSEYIEGAVEFTGKETAYVYLAMVATSDPEEALKVLENSIVAAESEDTGKQPDPNIPVVTVQKLVKPEEDDAILTARFLAPESGTYTLVGISYSMEEETNNKGQVIRTYSPEESAYATVKFTSINDLAGDDKDWNSLGIGEYTDDLLCGFFYEVDPVTYEVEVQESKTTPGVYRLKSPYGPSTFPYTQNFTDFKTADENMLIDATNPQCVKVPSFTLGNVGQYSQVNVSSYSWYVSDTKTDDEIIAAGIAGTLEDGIISFSAPKTFLAFFNGSAYYSNPDGAFMVVLPNQQATAHHKVVKREIRKAIGTPYKTKFIKANLRKMRKVAKSTEWHGTKRGMDRLQLETGWQIPMLNR